MGAEEHDLTSVTGACDDFINADGKYMSEDGCSQVRFYALGGG